MNQNPYWKPRYRLPALQRVADLSQESGVSASPSLICESIEVVIAMEADPIHGRKVTEMKLLQGYEENRYVFKDYR